AAPRCPHVDLWRLRPGAGAGGGAGDDGLPDFHQERAAVGGETARPGGGGAVPRPTRGARSRAPGRPRLLPDQSGVARRRATGEVPGRVRRRTGAVRGAGGAGIGDAPGRARRVGGGRRVGAGRGGTEPGPGRSPGRHRLGAPRNDRRPGNHVGPNLRGTGRDHRHGRGPVANRRLPGHLPRLRRRLRTPHPRRLRGDDGELRRRAWPRPPAGDPPQRLEARPRQPQGSPRPHRRGRVGIGGLPQCCQRSPAGRPAGDLGDGEGTERGGGPAKPGCAAVIDRGARVGV
ncbi:MAG: Endonuclease IV, partial [uncultured Thermomicrobiales bacterium]